MPGLVLIRLRNVNSLIEGDLPIDVRDAIRKTLSYVIPNFKFMATYKYAAVPNGRKWDGTKTVALLNKGGVPGLTIPTGLAAYAKEILDAKGVPCRVEDERLVAVPTPGWATQGLVLRDYQVPVVEEALKRQRGVIKASTGCHREGQSILMFDESIKHVEDIVAGDLLMGPDGGPRRVFRLIRGKGQMYEVKPCKGQPFVVNDNHVLSLQAPNKTIIDVPLNEWLKWGNAEKRAHKLYRSMPCTKQKKTFLRTGFDVKKMGVEPYYGFTLDGDGRYLLEDFTVTHNSGKTEMVIEALVRATCFPAVFYVTSCDLLLQAKERFQKYVTYNGLPAKIGQVGAGQCDIRPITIATIQSCERVLTGKYTKYAFDDYSEDDKTEFSESQKADIREMVTSAQFITSDECQHCSCDTIQTIMNASHSARFRFGCSASPWRDDGLDILIEACFGRRLCDITASFLIDEGYLLRPVITFNHFNQALGDHGTFNAHYESFVVDNVVRNQWVADRTNLHVSKGRPTIVLVKWVKHAEKLAPLIPGSEILCSSGDPKKSPKRRKEYLDAMRERRLMCVIGTSLLDEGVDVPAAGAGIFAGGGKSSTRELQRVGRFIRPDPSDPGKEIAYIEEFYDHTRWLRNHARLRRKILETEPGFEIRDNNASLAL